MKNTKKEKLTKSEKFKLELSEKTEKEILEEMLIRIADIDDATDSTRNYISVSFWLILIGSILVALL